MAEDEGAMPTDDYGCKLLKYPLITSYFFVERFLKQWNVDGIYASTARFHDYTPITHKPRNDFAVGFLAE